MGIVRLDDVVDGEPVNQATLEMGRVVREGDTGNQAAPFGDREMERLVADDGRYGVRFCLAEARAIARHAPTAFLLLEDRAELKAGEWVLIMGAAGGLGS